MNNQLKSGWLTPLVGARWRPIVQALRLLLAATVVFWSIAPAVAVAADEPVNQPVVETTSNSTSNATEQAPATEAATTSAADTGTTESNTTNVDTTTPPQSQTMSLGISESNIPSDGNIIMLSPAVATTRVSGTIFRDMNNNGVRNLPQDSGFLLGGIVIQKTDGSAPLAPAVVGTDGYWQYDLPPGEYWVNHVGTPPDWNQTLPDPNTVDEWYTITVGALPVNNLDFGFHRDFYSKLSGYKRIDANGDGVLGSWVNGQPSPDPNHVGIPNWPIYLDEDTNHDGAYEHTTTFYTSSDPANIGYFEFLNLNADSDWRVSESNPSGWTQTYPASKEYLIPAQDTACDHCYSFGNFQNVSISGMKFNDQNGDGSKTGDPGLPNWTIFLDKLNGTEISTTTDANGHYSFPDLGPGTYYVREVPQNNWTKTAPATDGYDITAESGVTYTDKDFGNFHNFTKTFALTVNEPILGATYFVDYTTGGNGGGGGTLSLVRDGSTNTFKADLSGLTSPVTINSWTWRIMYGALPVWSKTITPDDPETLNEDYSNTYAMSYGVDLQPEEVTNQENVAHAFTATVRDNEDGTPLTNLPVWYSATAPATVSPLPPQSTNTSGQITFQANSLTATTATIRAWVNETDGALATGYDNGEAADTSIKHWIDYNVTVSPESATNVVGVDHIMTVTLTKNEGSGYQTVVGDTVNLVLTGTVGYIYSVNGLVQSPGTMSTTGVTRASPAGTIEVVISATAAGSSTLMAIYPYAVAGGEVTATSDPGNKTWEYGSISGMKFNDLNGDGIKDAGEPGLAGWTINATGPVTNSATTEADGSYTIPNLPAGNYTITETQQPKWTQTHPIGGTHSATINDSNRNIINQDFGNFQNFSISGAKFNDLDGDGKWDTQTEAGLPNWTIFLDTNNDGQLNGTEISTTTGANGAYSFTDLGPGTYHVKEVQKAGWIQTAPETGGYDITGLSGQDLANRDFGNSNTGSVTGHKWDDLNGNGTWEKLTEPGLAGWTILLTPTQTAPIGQNNAGGVNPQGSPPSTVTGAGGAYLFENIPAGTYVVTEVLKEGWTQTYPGATSFSHTITVIAGKTTDLDNNEHPIDFGNKALGVINGIVWNDVNANQVIDSGEPRLSGWTVTLYADDQTTKLGSQLSAADGSYHFENLPPGTYWTAETLYGPEWSNTTPIRLRLVLVTAVDGTVSAGVANFGNDKPFLPFTPGSMPYTGGLYYQHPFPANAHLHPNASSPSQHGRSDGLLLALFALFGLSLSLISVRRIRWYADSK